MVKAKVSILLMNQGKIIIRPSYLKVVKEVSILLMSQGKIIMIIIRPSYLKMVKEVSILGEDSILFQDGQSINLDGSGEDRPSSSFQSTFFFVSTLFLI